MLWPKKMEITDIKRQWAPFFQKLILNKSSAESN